jgi:hypothetical protein
VKPDIKIALLGFGIGIVGTIASLYLEYGQGLAITVVLSSFIYLLAVRRNEKDSMQQIPKVDSRDEHIFHLSFLIVTTIAIAFLWISIFSFLYNRPLEYFIGVAFFSVVIVVEIGTLRQHGSKLDLYNILAQILLLGAAVRWSVLFSFPDFVGVDPWCHAFGVKHILRTGHVFTAFDILNYDFVGYSSLSEYSSRPIMHVLISEAQLLAPFPSLKQAFAFSIGISEIISLLFVFMLARRILNDTRGAALASLLVAMSSFHIKWGFWIIPMTTGLVFFSLLLYLLHFDQKTPNQRKVFGLSVLILIVMVFTHSIAAFIWVLILIFYWMAEKMLRSSFRVNTIDSRSSFLPVLAILILAANWTFSYFIDDQIRWALSSTALMPMEPIVRNPIQFEIDHIGTYILYFLAILGGLSWLKRLDRSKKSMIFGAAGLSVIMYGSGLIGLIAILPERWFAFLLITLAPIAASGYLFLGRSLHKGKIVLPLVILIFTFFMVISTDCNIDSPVFYPETAPPRAAFKESEMMAAQTAASIFSGDLYTDARFASLRFSLEREVVSVDFSNFDTNAIDGLVIIRKSIYNNNATLGVTLENELEKINKVYSNGEVGTFVAITNVSRNLNQK